jgi:uncharacterized membrane protein
MENFIARFHLHPIIDHFTIALLAMGVLADVLASAGLAPLSQRSQFLARWHGRLKATALQLLVVGALAATLSRFTGESEAERLWDTMSPGAQQLLWSDAGWGRLLSHAMLGTYLMYAFVVLASWRVLQEISRLGGKTRPLYLVAALMAVVALLYQGKTGGELVYDHGVGMTRTTGNAKHIAQRAAHEHTAGIFIERQPDQLSAGPTDIN